MGMGMKIGCLTWICQEVGIYVLGVMVHIMENLRALSKGAENPPWLPHSPPQEIRDSEAHHHPPIRRYQGRDFLRDKMPTEIFRKELPEGIL